MQRFVVTAIAALLLTMSPAFAGGAKPTPVPKVDINQVRRDLGPISPAFGVPSPEPTATDSADLPKQKTMADVTDRALDMVNNMTVKISETLSKIAPEVWRIMIRQQYAKAISGPLLPLSWIIGMLLFSGLGLKYWSRITEEGEEFNKDGPTGKGVNNWGRITVLKLLPLVVCTKVTIDFVHAIAQSVLYVMNPEYYAIQDLLKSIMTGGQG